MGLTDCEREVLRILNGEDVPGWVAGAALWTVCEELAERGLAAGHYHITPAGRAAIKDTEHG